MAPLLLGLKHMSKESAQQFKITDPHPIVAQPILDPGRYDLQLRELFASLEDGLSLRCSSHEV